MKTSNIKGMPLDNYISLIEELIKEVDGTEEEMRHQLVAIASKIIADIYHHKQ